MKTCLSQLSLLTTVLLAAALSESVSFAQPARPDRGPGPQGPRVVSPEVVGDCKVTFRVLAPAVRLPQGLGLPLSPQDYR